MEITIFAKRRQTMKGQTFYSYLTTLTRKDGTPCTCSVKFLEPAETPDPIECPMNIVVEPHDVSMSKEKYTDKDGTEKYSHKLWVRAYKQGSPYVDKSMEDFI